MDDIVEGSKLRAESKSEQERKVEPISKVGIVGGGQMGSGIAHVVALGGYDVAINDIADAGTLFARMATRPLDLTGFDQTPQ